MKSSPTRLPRRNRGGHRRFRQFMEVELVNDGPVTILLDTDELSRPRRG